MIYTVYTYNVWRDILGCGDDDKAIWNQVNSALKGARIALLNQVSFEDEKSYRIEFVKKYWDESDIVYWLTTFKTVHGLYPFGGGLCGREYIEKRMCKLKPYHLELHINERPNLDESVLLLGSCIE